MEAMLGDEYTPVPHTVYEAHKRIDTGSYWREHGSEVWQAEDDFEQANALLEDMEVDQGYVTLQTYAQSS